MTKQFMHKSAKQDQSYDYEIQEQENQMKDKQEYKVRNKKLDFKGQSEGEWTKEQNIKYVVFMNYYENIFYSKQKRKVNRIFRSLSDYIKTRNPSQCRSHFQKLLNKFEKLKKVFSFYREQAGSQVYQEYYRRVPNDIKGINVIKKQDLASTCEKKFVESSVQTDQYSGPSFYNQLPTPNLYQPQQKFEQTSNNFNNYMSFMEFVNNFQL